MYRKILYLLFLFEIISPFLPGGVCHSQTLNIEAEYYTSIQGLSQHYIYAVLQDYKGFMWFGTKDGLNRFDGYSFKVYRNDPLDSTTLSDNYVMSLYEDKDSNLWIGTASGGLSRFNRNTETFTNYPNTTRDPVTNSYFHINALYRDDGGNIWIGTNGQGLFLYDPVTAHIELLLKGTADNEKPDIKRIYKIYEDLKKRIWITTVESGLILAENNSGKFRFKSFIPEKDKPGIEGITINTVFQPRFSSNETLWVGTNKGLMKFNPLTGKFTDYIINSKNDPDIWVWQIEETRDGALWISYLDELVKYYPATGKYHVVNNSDDPTINKMVKHAARLYTDRSGVLWIGTTGYGILRYNPKVEQFGKQGKYIRNYILDDLFQIPADIQKIVRPNFISPRSLVEEPDSTLWISIDGRGVVKYSLSEKKIIKDFSPVCQPDFALTEPVNIIDEKIAPYFGQIIKHNPKNSRENELWIGTEKGVLRMSTTTGICNYLRIYPKFQTPDVQPNNTGYPDISAMLEDANGVVWLGTPTSGLVRVDPFNYSIRFFRNVSGNPNSLSNDAILCIERDPFNKNIIWVGTDGGGVNKFNTSSETFTHIQEGSGFPNNVVYGILKDDKKNLWISTNKGLALYNSVTGKIRTYDVKQGLQDNEFNRYEFFQSLDGTMYFGGINGCNVFKPEDLSDNMVIPSVVLTDFKLFNRSVPLSTQNEKTPLSLSVTETKLLQLDYSQNVITFEFTALEFSSPSNNNYAYKLEGFDNNWVYSGSERNATYTNLDPGEYLFRVKASNNDGIWNESGMSLMVTILPPYWMTWWFRGLLTIILITGITAVVIILERRKAAERARQAEREAALERERLRIARDMHDDLGARLTEISMIGDLAQRNGGDAEVLKKTIEKITGVARETVSIFDEIVWAVNPRYDHLEHIANYFSQYATEYLGTADIRCKLMIPEELPDIPVSAEARHNVLMVLKEVLNNVVKHACASIVLISIKLYPEGVQFIIEDNGKGFEDGRLRMEDGRWKMEDGRGKMEDGKWAEQDAAASYNEGLAGMKFRMESIGGTVLISSEPGKGTKVELFLPLELQGLRK